MKTRSCLAARAALAVALALPFAVTSLSAKPALAQPKDKASLDEAKDRFKRGLALYKEGSLDAALVEFSRAYDLSPSWKILYNIAVVHRDQRNYVEALGAFERFLAGGGKQIDAAKKKEVDAEIEQLRKFVGKLAIAVNVAGAEVRVDDQLVGKAPLAGPIAVNAGKRRVSATAEGRTAASDLVTVAGGDEVKVTLSLAEPPKAEPVVVAPAAPPPQEPARAPEPPPSRMTTLSYVGFGAAGALAIGAGVTGFMAQRASKDLSNMEFVGATPSPEVEDQRSKVKRLALTTDVLAGAALATFGVTLYLTLSRTPTREQAPAAAQLHLSIAPGSLGLGGTFR